ncbi:efflux transporter outer membrane subunit [Ferrimonas lipolytica]|uniref:Efflux transporter outer membrane subunit n=1 Tax=Ferrimonas lipolytica TaxID=2724191 RepID=A0A6H1UBH9_9GAMM|nr:efflux transporter outer membrane subunit [Ferrimonas lipolytica]QIZ76415.1 efflux transporter outer membrane subunit [Ferrimonas lipolytica]
MKKLITLVVSVALTGCVNLADDYQRPDAPMDSTWLESNLQVDEVSSASTDWRQFILDPKLRELIELGLEHNRDLRIAQQTLLRTQALYGIQKSELFPNVDVSVGAANQRIPEAVTTPESISRQYNVDVGLFSYELDFFGRIANLEQQALFNFLASEQGRRNTEIVVIGQIASTYLSVVADTALLNLAQETLDSQISSLQLTEQSFENGVVSGLDVAQAKVTVATAQVDLARFRNQLAADRHALAVLVGTKFDGGLLPDDTVQQWLAPVQIGMPSDLLTLRPDIVQAEYLLMAGNANIGAARAAYFPSISLTASSGLLSSDLDDLFSGDARSWSFSPGLTLPIFHWGELDANLELAEADQQLALAQYEQTIQNAFREVADALSARQYLAEQLEAQKRLVDATGESFYLSDLRFRQGVDSFYNVLDSQRSYFAAQQSLISLAYDQQNNLLSLFRALGGGWQGNPVLEQ